MTSHSQYGRSTSAGTSAFFAEATGGVVEAWKFITSSGALAIRLLILLASAAIATNASSTTAQSTSASSRRRYATSMRTRGNRPIPIFDSFENIGMN